MAQSLLDPKTLSSQFWGIIYNIATIVTLGFITQCSGMTSCHPWDCVFVFKEMKDTSPLLQYPGTQSASTNIPIYVHKGHTLMSCTMTTLQLMYYNFKA